MIVADPTAMHQINPRKWEEMIAGWYKEYGFDEVTLTPASGDRGRDVIAVKHGALSVRILDQVKAYKPGHLVTANDVRALLGVLAGDRAATKGLVTTTSEFAPGIDTDPSIAPFVPTRLEMVNGAELVRRLGDLSKK
ncbi:restriction endonuclease [Fimbriiglobus ruber]|nr:restriction endonuclease [Fimbriiglobus ruber]